MRHQIQTALTERDIHKQCEPPRIHAILVFKKGETIKFQKNPHGLCMADALPQIKLLFPN